MHKFNRNYQKWGGTIAILVLICDLVITVVGAISLSAAGTASEGKTIINIFFGLLFVALIIAVIVVFLPEDFDYTVEVKQNFIIFSRGDYDRRVMQRPYTTQINGKKITIYDGNAVITVPYDQKVFKFLEGLNDE